MKEYSYDETASYDVNFNRWYHANTVEREMYKEDKMSFDTAIITFRKMWGFKQIAEKVWN